MRFPDMPAGRCPDGRYFARPGQERFTVRGADSDRAEILLYDEIGFFGISAEAFVRELDGITAPAIDLRINSPGGSVFDAAAMFNALERHQAAVTSHIDGVAASAASVIALAGDEVVMARNALFMIHNPWSFVIGEESDMLKEAGLLRKVKGTIARVYAEATGIDLPAIGEMMTAETWLDSEEAVEAGFADSVAGGDEAADGESAVARFDLASRFRHPPEGAGGEPGTPSKRTTEQILRDAGFSRSEAQAILAGGWRSVAPRDAADAERELVEACAAAAEIITI